ncbi:MAG: ATP-dependent Clp protease proteolytic subunit [Bacteroidia bacterium]|nr:ATP-dependent Clp protease proteolytic subunit [Bacteroidia bacterium]
MEGHIYIEGLIGSTKDQDGNVIERGVELQDVIAQAQALKGIPTIFCHINSEGGYVEVGKKIADYLASLPNVITIAETLCASIATEIHLSVPVERRKIAEGTKYLIHSPMFSMQRGVALNADQLSAMSEDIAITEKEMASMYAKATGLDKTALELLMKQETSLTPEQCKQFGFVSEILPAKAYKAVALITPKQKSNTNDMSEVKKDISWIKTALAAITKKFEGEKVSLDATTKDGFKIVIDTTEEAPKVGDKVMDENGKSLDPGKYETQWGTLVVVDGSIAEIIPAMAAANPEMDALQAKYDALVSERTAEQTEIAELKKDVEAMAKLTSTYKPAAEKVAFRKDADKDKPAAQKSIKEIRAERAAKAAAAK